MLVPYEVAWGYFIWEIQGRNCYQDKENISISILIFKTVYAILGLPGSSEVKNPPAMQETGVQSLGWEDTLKESMTTHSSILVWRIPWTEETGGLQSIGSQTVGHD